MLELKRTFVRMVSHEIRTPLNVVLTGLKVIEKELLKRVGEDELLDTVRDSKASCDTSIDLLNDLLAYEKLEAGIMSLDKSLVAVRRLITDSMRPFRLQVQLHTNILTIVTSYLYIVL